MSSLPSMTVITTEGEFDVRPSPADNVRFEREYGIASDEVDGSRMEHVMFLTYCACKRLGHTDLDFDSWLDTLLDIRDPEEESEDPTGDDRGA